MTSHSLPTLRVGPETPSESVNLKVSVRKRKGLFGHKPRKTCQNEKQEMKMETNQGGAGDAFAFDKKLQIVKIVFFK